MKTEFNDELKYVDLLLPTLKLLDNETKTENELIEILRNDRIYRVYNKQIITDELENTLDYLQKTDYINQDNINEYQITTIGSDLIENLYHEEDKIMKKDISYEEKQKRLTKNENTQRNKIIKKINQYYKVPTRRDFYKLTLEYLKENPNHKLNRKDMQIDIILSNFPPEILNILTAKKGIVAYPRVDFAVYYLFHTNYITKKGKEYYITDKGLKNIDNPNLADIVEKEYEKSKNPKSDETQTLDDKKNDEFKTIFKDEITYLDLIIPVINIVNENTIGEDLLFEKIREINKFKKYDDDLILKKIRKTIFYITQLNYITPTINNKIKITQKGIEYQNELSKKIQKIRQKNLTSDELNKQIIKTQKKYTNKINRELIKKYDIPSANMIYYDLLNFIKDNPYNTPTKNRDLIIDFIKSQNYSDEQLGILTMGVKEIMVNSRATIAHIDLKYTGLVEETNDHKFHITQKGLEYLNDENLVDMINSDLEEYWNNYRKENKNTFKRKKDELTYIELILPILRELKNSSKTLDELNSFIENDTAFEDYPVNSIPIEVENTLFYLQKIGYIEVIDNQLQLTIDAINFLDTFQDELIQIDDENLNDTDKQKEILKANKRNISRVNDKIKEVFNIPKQPFFYKDILEYVRDNPKSIKGREQLTEEFIKQTYNFTDKQMQVLLGTCGGVKYSTIISRAYYSIGNLKDAEYIEETSDKKFYITQKGLENIERPDLGKHVRKIVNRNDNIELPSLPENNELNSFNIYSNLILRILSNELSYKKSMITNNIINLIIPGNESQETINLFRKEVEKTTYHMLQDELITQAQKTGYYKITQKGLNLINDNNITDVKIEEIKDENPDETLDEKLTVKPEEPINIPEQVKSDPLDVFNRSYNKINKSLPKKLLKKVRSCDPYFFEKLSLDLLKKMDFYKVKTIGGEVTSKSNDGGVDGLIFLDPLSIKPVYFQSKRWKSSISRPEMQKFVGALNDRSADTGIYITTSTFTKGAIKTARTANIKLIDGEKLVELMIEYNVGIKTKEYNIDMIDEEYFKENKG
ncbi:restriction endonuclease [Methanosphaera cuniculi]|uniref:restriction endonuclease n=1 Tax=Methanosphaera cuniculi TaxID=1077256 RepID=UPI0026EFBB49|nr:restriction endonuclease [Methanosphaera cuniculi]